MRIILSNHAIMRARQREITMEQITDCIQNPDELSDEPEGKKCYKKLQNGSMLLLCYTIQYDDSIKIITLILTSKVKKYRKI
jgi:hypothetical protein